MNLIRLWESMNLNVFIYMCAQVNLVPIPYDSKCVTVSVFTSVSVSVCVSVSNNLVDYQWYLVSSAQHLVSRIQYLVSGIYSRFLLGHIMQRILQESASRAD